MWERKVKTAKWNGVAFNIQQTTLDNGKRLHVVELPYADEPQIKVMGAKAKGINLEAVFVGVNSLADANAFVAELESDPIGSLEHPYLGEMALVYQSVSQSFSTKKGLVTLSLKFLKQGKDIVLTRTSIDDKPVSQLSDDVTDASSAQLVRDVKQASPEEVSSLQDDFNKVLNTLRSVANRATQGSMMLTRLHNQIQDGINAVNTIINAPAAFAAHLKAIINSLVKVLSDDNGALVVNAAASGLQSASVKQSAAKSLRKAISSGSVSAHCNIQIAVAIVLLSDELALLTADDAPQLTTFGETSIDQVSRDINAISTLLEERINEVTKSADYESLALVEALTALRESVINQHNKIDKLLQSVKRIEVVHNRPLLCIAQSSECMASELSTLNPIAHPLFVSGTLQVPNE